MKYIILFLFIVNSGFVSRAAIQEEFDRKKIVKLLEEAYQRDQAPRAIMDSLMRNGVTDGNLFLPAIKQQREADSINHEVVLPIIDTLYKLQIYDLDSTVYKWCWVIIQHADNETMVKYADFIEHLAKRNLIPLTSYMSFIDRGQIRQEKAQIYGYQFKRFANGILMQFPILKGQRKKWKELGSDYSMDNLLPTDYTVNYKATRVKKNQFVVIGFLYKGENDSPIEDLSPLEDIQILLNKRKKTNTDSNGFFKIVVPKKKLPLTIEVLINETRMEYEIVCNEDKSFSISIGYVSDGKIDVMRE